MDALTDKFKHLVLYKSVLEGCSDERKCYVVGSDASSRLAREVNENYLGGFYIVGVL